MRFGICELASVPVRQQPSHKSELTSQLVFGETYLVLQTEGRWVQIECAYDGYTGWIAASQDQEIPEEEFRKLKHAPPVYVAEPVAWLESVDGAIRRLVPAGSLLPHYDRGKLRVGEREYALAAAQLIERAPAFTEENLLRLTSIYLHAPYLWGGRTPFGIDCSGFAQKTFRYFGKKLLRDAYQQAEQGAPVARLADARPGDLAFFEEEGRITHVGIILAGGRIIHAAGRVKICPLDDKGIFDAEAERYSHYLERIKRL